MDKTLINSLSLVFFPDEILRHSTAELSLDMPNLPDIVARMDAIMKNREGVGLAGPQVGLGLSLFISRPSAEDALSVFINPKITAFSAEKELGEEGCLSVPGIYAPVERSLGIEVEYFDLKGKACKQEFKGFMARIIQHEADHLTGTLFFDHLASGTKRKVLKEYFHYLKQNKRNR